MDIQDFHFTSRLKVHWGDMDAAQHVNNSMYFRYVETARVEYFAAIGWVALLKNEHIGPILSETHARYKRPLVFPDEIIVGVKTTSIEPDRFHMSYAIYSESQACVTTELTGTIVAYDYREKKKAILPQAVIDGIRRVEQNSL